MSFCLNEKEEERIHTHTNRTYFCARVALCPNGLRFSRFRFGKHKICTYWLVPVCEEPHRKKKQIRSRWNEEREKKEQTKIRIDLLLISMFRLVNKTAHILSGNNSKPLKLADNDFQLKFMIRRIFLWIHHKIHISLEVFNKFHNQVFNLFARISITFYFKRKIYFKK